MQDGRPPVSEDLLGQYLAKRADLVRFFTARTGSAVEAEDVVQELYFKIAEIGAGEIENGSAYLYRLGLNLMLDRYRSTQRRQRRENEYHRSRQVAPGTEETIDAPSSEEAIDARFRLARLLEIASKLPPQCKRVFQMHKLEGRSHREVAIALGISRSAVEKHMIAALKRLGEV